MIATVLFVCSANVCRSPLAEAIASSRAKTMGAPELVFASAGVRASPGEQRCTVAEKWLQGRGVSVHPHDSVALTPAMAHGADLVIALDRSVVATILTMAPTVRNKTFTLLEAEALVRAHSASPESWEARSPHAVDPLTWYVAELNAARGFVQMPPAPRSRRAFRSRRHSRGLDVQDVHQTGAGWNHRQILPLVSAKTTALVDGLLTVTTVAA